MSVSILVPQINSVLINPSTVSANTSFTISISVSEISKDVDPVIYYCGTLNTGEQKI